MADISRKRGEAYYLALKVCHSTLTPTGHYFDVRDSLGTNTNDEDTVWAWADGLMSKFYDECIWPIDQQIERIQKDIDMMTPLLQQLGEPVRLTHEELTNRGYSGH